MMKYIRNRTLINVILIIMSYETFYDDWMRHSNYWFQTNANFDNYLINVYSHLLDELDELNELDTNKGIIIKVLVYDQLTRHIYRNQNAEHIISYYNRKALDICVGYKDNRGFIDGLKDEEWIFYLLVYRHTNKRDNLLYVMSECWKRPINLLIKRFIKATYKRANFEEELDIYDSIFNINENDNYDKLILDERCREKNGKILELDEIGDYGYIDNYDKNEPIIISLSGGVDSITCLYMLKRRYKDRHIIGCHINYNNREETDDEVKFLIHICNQIGIRLYVRKIDEIKRGICIKNDLRDTYESYTKMIRFNVYKKVYEIEMGKDKGDNKPLIIMGHNKDDCFENILTNIAYMNKYDNLDGINKISIINDVYMYRPLLDITKEIIYKNANECGYLYLKNSTPVWSQRGKIRDSVVPILERWDRRVIDGLFELSGVLKDLHINLMTNVDKFKEAVNNMDINDLNMSELYWKYGIFKIFGLYPSNKSLKTLIERFRVFKLKYDKIDIRKGIKIIITKDIYICIWKCRENKMGYYITNGKNAIIHK